MGAHHPAPACMVFIWKAPPYGSPSSSSPTAGTTETHAPSSSSPLPPPLPPLHTNLPPQALPPETFAGKSRTPVFWCVSMITFGSIC
ncbi:hypothetical protein ACS0TY_025580 [Phlomoides rotata]